MADLQCPLCGTLNLEDAEVCKNCGAALILQDAVPEQADESGEEPLHGLPEWLRDAMEDEPSDEEAAPESEGEQHAADWLSEIIQEGADKDVESVALPGDVDAEDAGEEEGEDWLSKALAGTPSDGERKPAEADEEPPEWLEEALDEKPLHSDAGDWFSRPEEAQDLPISAEPTVEEPAREPEAAKAAAEEEIKEAVDWLAELQEMSADEGDEPEETAAEAEAAAAEDEAAADVDASPDAIPDWMGESGVEEESEETVDWLAELQEQPADERDEPEETAAEDEAAAAEAEAAVAEGEAAADVDASPDAIPDWMGESGVEEESEEAVDWLAELQEQPADGGDEPKETAAEAEAAADVDASPDAIPDWMGESGVEEESEETVDWLAELQEQPADVGGEPEETAAEAEAAAAETDAAADVDLQPAQSEDDLEWLSELEEDGLPAAEDKAVEGEIPDWLQEAAASKETPALESVAEPPVEEQASPEPKVKIAPPAWLRNPKELPAEEDPQVLADLELPQWLEAVTPQPETGDRVEALVAEVRTQEDDSGQIYEMPVSTVEAGVAQEDVVGEAVQPAAAEETGLPAWVTQAEEQPADDLLGEEDLPKWLEEATTAAADEDAVEADAVDWLTALSGEEEAEPQPDVEALQSTVLGAVPEGETPEWLEGLEEDTAAQPEVLGEAVEGETPEWLEGLEEDTAAQPAAPEETPEGEKPDWLAELQAAEPAELAVEAEEFVSLEATEDSPAVSDELVEGDVPAWLAEFQEDAPMVETEGEAVEQPAADETVTEDQSLDWLAELQEESSAAEQENGEPEVSDITAETEGEDAAVEAEDLPDWLRSAGVEEPVKETGEPGSESELDWMSETVLTGESEAAPEGPAEEESLFDWMETPDTAKEPQEEPLEKSGEGVSDWLSRATAPQGEGLEDEVIDTSPFADDRFSRWASTYDEELEEDTAEEEAADEPMPEWLKEMNPIEATLPREEDLAGRPIEKSGPLAGLADVLPTKDVFSQLQPPAVYSARLDVSEKQRSQAALFESLLAEETQPRKLPSDRRREPSRAIRMAVGVLMILLLAIPVFGGLQVLSLPNFVPIEVQQFFSQVENNLTLDGEPVLLAVDYEPGYSGEMRISAMPVIEHLMSRNTRLTLVSTVPSGPFLAEELLRAASLQNSDYRASELTFNLGYLAGNAYALQEFALSPRDAATYGLNSLNAWNSHLALEGITQLEDYSLVIVMVDNVNTARTWVEQVQPSLGEVPLLMVVSSQAAPLLAPYVDSGQVDGLIAGLSGGVAYEQLSGRGGAGRAYWDAYKIGLTLAAGVILLGALLQLLPSASSRRKRRKKV